MIAHTLASATTVFGSSRVFVAGVNHLLKDADWARERLVVHPGRVVRLRADPIDIRFAIAADGTLTEADSEAEPEVTLSFPLSEAPRLVSGDLSRIMNAVRIEGSADLAEAVGFVFRNLRWDIEEDLSRVVGDIAAHRMVSAAHSVRDMHSRAWQALGANVSEYLGEEQGVLLTRRFEVGFADDLRALRDDVARLEKRVARIEGRSRDRSR